jgi:hypothetical protein
VNNWYGKEERTVETVSDTASWHSTGFLPAVLLRWVLIRDPQVSHRRHASSARATLEMTFLDPAVDTPLKRCLSSTARALTFSAICRTFRSGGTRIRTGDTMIFSHMQKPLGMRKTRVGKRICVH